MITQKEFKQRRDLFAKKLKKNSLAYFGSAKVAIRSNDTEFPYRQESNFYYLTGFTEENAHLIFIKTNKKTKIFLFVQKKEPLLELWTGERLGKDAAKKIFLVDKVFHSHKLDEKINFYLKNLVHFYYDFSNDFHQISKKLCKKRTFRSHRNIEPILGLMRLIKSSSEIKMIEESLKITKKTHHSILKDIKNFHNESEILAKIEYIFKKNGAYNDAYTSIVASGNNANTLHYIKNNSKLSQGDLILIDAGCELEYYASDITRTIPKRGSFTQEQKELYEMVLNVQEVIISKIKPGVKRSILQKKAIKLLVKGMIRLGILKGDIQSLIKEEKYKKYYPHGIGHWMGLDVHDNSPYIDKKFNEIPLQENMVLTIEPGIYLPKNDLDIPAKYRGIGIRIEDNILVTKNGYKNLSCDIVKSVKDIEKMAQGFIQ